MKSACIWQSWFVVDSEVTVVNEIAGNLIVQVKESRLALDRTMANRNYDRLNSAARCFGTSPTLEWSLNKDK